MPGERPKFGCSPAKPFQGEPVMVAIAEANSLFEIDAELDSLLDVIEEQVASDGQPSEDLVARFYQFCDAHGEKVDRSAASFAWKRSSVRSRSGPPTIPYKSGICRKVFASSFP
jgi:hypothetical protein